MRDGTVLAICLAGAAGLSLLLGQDANWDLQNYHYYNPWAWWHDRRGYAHDVVAAQLQTYHNPIPDLPFYWMVTQQWDPRAIAAALAVPAGVALFFLWKLLVLLFGDLPRIERWAAIGAALAIGGTSSIGLGVLGTTMNEWPGTACVAAALYLIARALATNSATPLASSPLVIAGLLCGMATGSKFTFGVFAVALCTAILLRGPWGYADARAALWDAFRFGLAVLAGTLATAGAWMLSLWEHFRNPIFPYGNAWIKSPWWGDYEALARAFGPHTALEWLAFPFTLASPPPFYVTEVTLVDGRIPAVFALALTVFAAALVRRARKARGTDDNAREPASRPLVMLATFFAVSFVMWTAQYSILRYLVPLALVSGALIVAMLNVLVRPAARAPAAIMAAVMLVGTTTAADWWRIDFGKEWFDIRMPPVDSNALVLLATDGPMAYVLPAFPPDARFLGINNSISDARRKTLMEETIARTIRDHRGPIYEMSYPWGTGVDALLERQLRRLPDRCAPIVTSMRTSPIEFCRVERIPDRTAPAQ